MTPRTRAVVLCNPSNPTGAPVDAAHGARIVQELADRDIFVISDETYMQFVYDADHWSAASVPGWRRNVVVIGTFSKSFAMMGWRVGFVLADRAICEQATKIQDAMIICAPMISQIVAEGAVTRRVGVSATVSPRVHRGGVSSSRTGSQRSRRCSGRRPAAGSSRSLASPAAPTRRRSPARLLEEAHVVTIPGAAFGQSGEGCLRLSFGSVSGEDLVEGLDRLEDYFSRGG